MMCAVIEKSLRDLTAVELQQVSGGQESGGGSLARAIIERAVSGGRPLRIILSAYEDRLYREIFPGGPNPGEGD